MKRYFSEAGSASIFRQEKQSGGSLRQSYSESLGTIALSKGSICYGDFLACGWKQGPLLEHRFTLNIGWWTKFKSVGYISESYTSFRAL